LNMHKNDRKCLAFTALSFVDVLRPPFFIMESVPGFLQWKVQGTTHEIKAGDLKLVLKLRYSAYLRP
jgi:site-specific DNA-cytosine methylase